MLKEGFAASEDLKKEIQTHVKTRLAAHEYPQIKEVNMIIMTFYYISS